MKFDRAWIRSCVDESADEAESICSVLARRHMPTLSMFVGDGLLAREGMYVIFALSQCNFC